MGFNGRVFLLVITQLIMESTEKTPITILKMIKVIQDGRRNVAWSFNTKIGNKQRKDPVPMRESSDGNLVFFY